MQDHQLLTIFSMVDQLLNGTGTTTRVVQLQTAGVPPRSMDQLVTAPTQSTSSCTAPTTWGLRLQHAEQVADGSCHIQQLFKS